MSLFEKRGKKKKKEKTWKISKVWLNKSIKVIKTFIDSFLSHSIIHFFSIFFNIYIKQINANLRSGNVKLGKNKKWEENEKWKEMKKKEEKEENTCNHQVFHH